MPVYDYLCDDCGAFTEMRPMAECELPSDCPDCGSSARRAYLTAPNYSSLSRETRLVHTTNERSAHAPKTLSSMKAEHGAGCSCCSGTSKKPGRLVRRGKNGSKTFPTARPWMISH
jgi:putative FmdB family regulatory protein